MATPKGMRAVQLSVSETDAVHVFSNREQIWIQLRRNIPTECDIGSPSFKTSFCLTPENAHELGSELLKLAARNTGSKKAQLAAPSGECAGKAPVKAKVTKKENGLCPHCKVEKTIENNGRQWCSKCGKYTEGSHN